MVLIITFSCGETIQAIAHNITELLDVRDNIRNTPGVTPSDIAQ